MEEQLASHSNTWIGLIIFVITAMMSIIAALALYIKKLHNHSLQRELETSRILIDMSNKQTEALTRQSENAKILIELSGKQNDASVKQSTALENNNKALHDNARAIRDVHSVMMRTLNLSYPNHPNNPRNEP
jgi:predicted Holliday junction resolvase-like endonuclease